MYVYIYIHIDIYAATANTWKLGGGHPVKEVFCCDSLVYLDFVGHLHVAPAF